MNLLLGMAPPPSVDELFVFVFVVACIGLALNGCLAYRLSKRRPNEMGVLLSCLIFIFTLTVSVGMGSGGVLAFLDGGVSGGVLFAGGSNAVRRRRHGGWLIAVCLLIGPIVGFGLYGLNCYVIDPHPADRYYLLRDFLAYGTIAGLLGALLVTTTLAVTGRRPRA